MEIFLDGPQHAGVSWSEQLSDTAWPLLIHRVRLYIVEPNDGRITDIEAVL